MHKRRFYGHPEDSAERVIAHAKWQAARGRQPSMPFSGEKNPRRALELAQATHAVNLRKTIQQAIRGDLSANPLERMTETAFQAALEKIVRTSFSIEEIQARLKKLNYPFEIEISIRPSPHPAPSENPSASKGNTLRMANGDEVLYLLFTPVQAP